MRHLAWILAAALTANPASAKDMDGAFAVFGAGGDTCRSYLQAQSQGGVTAQAFAEWTAAYLSAFNLIVPGTYNIIGQRAFPDLLDWLDGYCRKHPDETYVNAVAALTTQLYPTRANIAPGKDGRAKWGHKDQTEPSL